MDAVPVPLFEQMMMIAPTWIDGLCSKKIKCYVYTWIHCWERRARLQGTGTETWGGLVYVYCALLCIFPLNEAAVPCVLNLYILYTTCITGFLLWLHITLCIVPCRICPVWAADFNQQQFELEEKRNQQCASLSLNIFSLAAALSFECISAYCRFKSLKSSHRYILSFLRCGTVALSSFCAG